MQVKSALVQATQKLVRAGLESATLDARVLLQHVLSVTAEWLVANHARALDAEMLAKFDAVILRRCAHEPVAYITGMQDFWKDRFSVSRDTLIPRADSETMIEAACALIKGREAPRTILDLGTGSGCLLLSLLREFPAAEGVGIDISAGALNVAKHNTKLLSLDARSTFLLGDMRDNSSLPESPQHYDIIVSNPPYIPSDDIAFLARDVKDFEPRLALDGDSDGLNFYRSLFKWLPKRMHASSVCLLEVGHDQAQDVTALAHGAKLGRTQTFQDLAGMHRVVCVQTA